MGVARKIGIGVLIAFNLLLVGVVIASPDIIVGTLVIVFIEGMIVLVIYLVKNIGRTKMMGGLKTDRKAWGKQREIMWQLREQERIEDMKKLEQESTHRMREFEQEAIAKGLIKFITNNGQARWGTELQVKEWKALELNLSNNFSNLSPKEFERLVARLFRAMGYEVTDLPYVGDYGADLIAQKDNDTIVIQVKKFSYGNNVGAPEVQKTLGSMWKYKANKSIIVTTSSFTIAAKEQSKEAPVELWDIYQLRQITDKYLMSL